MKILLAVLLLAGPAAVRAAAPEGAPAHERAEDQARTVPGGASKGVAACHADVERFCKGVEPGEGRLGACLKKNRAKLSKKCLRWARHGGPGHEDEAFSELDKPATRPAQ